MNDQLIEVQIEGLNEKGAGLSEYNNRKLLVWNALPGETALVKIYKKRRKLYEAVAVEIVSPSKLRREAKEDHYLSCSPWQIMTNEAESTFKLQQANSLLEKNELGFSFAKLVNTNKEYHYRNKMEFSVYVDEGKLSLALFKRGQKGKIQLESCVLASEAINTAANQIIQQLNKVKYEGRPFKSLIVKSDQKGNAIAGLFITEKLELPEVTLSETLKGFAVFYSNPKSPASVIDEELYKIGELSLQDEILGTKLQHGLTSFFQVNIPIFEETLQDIADNIDPQRPYLDFYSGTGSISLPLAAKIKNCVLVDINQEAIANANQNIQNNQISNYSAIAVAAESATELINAERDLILDPPRSGLHKSVIKRILEVKPNRIIYLSCNINTQIADIIELKKTYAVSSGNIYNFFPNTPHVESLLILDRIRN